MAARGIRSLVRALAAGLLTAGALVTTGTAQAAPAAVVAHTWGNAMEVPGTAALNATSANLVSIACTTAGNCTAGGFFRDSGGREAFVVDQVNGAWGNAQVVPGTAALNPGGDAEVRSVACASAGNCTAGGFYADSGGLQQAFVADEVNGTWHSAREVPGTATLNAGGDAEIDTVSCRTAGNCSAGGEYTDSSSHFQAFVVNRVNGTWRTAREVPGTATLNAGGIADVQSLSCAAAGNCAAVGSYRDATFHTQAFVVTETGGTWHTARKIPGTATLAPGGASGNAVSCQSSGNCSAGGLYADASSNEQAFVVNEVSGTWRAAREVPGTAALNTGGSAQVAALSCGSAGNCSAGGSYRDSAGDAQGFLADEVNGTWRNAVPVPGLASLNAGGNARVAAVSCASAGNCSAGGFFFDSQGHSQPFVVDETSGVWGTAQQVPGSASLNAGGSMAIESLSCGSSGACGAGGQYADASNAVQAFVVNRS